MQTSLQHLVDAINQLDDLSRKLQFVAEAFVQPHGADYSEDALSGAGALLWAWKDEAKALSAFLTNYESPQPSKEEAP